MALLTASDLSLGYDGKVIAEKLNFSVSSGDYLCIIGANGSGKTTLMKTILHLKEPLKGQIQMGEGLCKNEIGYLPQQSLVQKDFPASVREIVLSGCQGRCGLRPFYTGKEKELALKNMQRMGVESLAHRCFRELSGGQQQRVLLARALCATKKMLFLDEPVAGLDPDATEKVYDLIARLNREEITILMISHDRDTALQYASHVLQLGENPFFGTKAVYLQGQRREAK